jgi:hypothetical protein
MHRAGLSRLLHLGHVGGVEESKLDNCSVQADTDLFFFLTKMN